MLHFSTQYLWSIHTSACVTPTSQVCVSTMLLWLGVWNWECVRLRITLYKVSLIVSEIARVGYTQTDRPIISLVAHKVVSFHLRKKSKLMSNISQWEVFGFHVKHWMVWILIFVVLGNLFIYVCSGGRTGWCFICLCKFWGLCSGANKGAVCLGSLILKSRRWRWHVSLKHWGTSRTLYPVTQWNIPEICNPLSVYFQITWLSRVSIFLIVWRVMVVTCDEDENINMIVCFVFVMSNFGTPLFNGSGCCVLRLFHSQATT